MERNQFICRTRHDRPVEISREELEKSLLRNQVFQSGRFHINFNQMGAYFSFFLEK